MRGAYRVAAIVMAVVMLICAFSGCAAPWEKYSYSFFDTFDTLVTVYGYSSNENDFNEFAAVVHDMFLELHRLFDAFNDYPGVNNIKTINDNAGKAPVVVDARIISLLSRSVELSDGTYGCVNIGMGSVTSLWSRYRVAANESPDDAALPTPSEIEQAGAHTNLNALQIDKQASSVYIEDAEMSIDVGAVAKGYACQLVKDAMVEAGYDSFVISAGGNVCTAGNQGGKGGDAWSIGIQNPDTESTAGVIDTLRIDDKSVVTAGGYQRFYVYDGTRYHHIIDPNTFMPANYYESVTVIADDSFVADFMATTLFILPLEQGRELADKMGICAVWINASGDTFFSSDYTQYSTLHSRVTE